MNIRTTHGTSTMYKKHGYRCDACRAAGREMNRQVNERRRAREAAGAATLAPGPYEALGLPPSTSWWVGAPRAGLTAYVEREQLGRMRTTSGRPGIAPRQL